MSVDGYGSTTATSWDRTIATTLPKHLREVEKRVLRQYLLLAMIQNGGRVLYNQSGEGITWPIQYKLHTGQGDLGEGPRSFQRKNQWIKAKLDYRGTTVSDSTTRRERLANRGEEAVVNFANGMISRLEESLGQAMGPQVYNNGYATGYETSWHGMGSWSGFTGTVDLTSATINQQVVSPDVEDRLGWANGQYGGIDQYLGAYGGSNGTDPWPVGNADRHFDFHTPLIPNYNSNIFNGASSTWNVQCVEVLRWTLANGQRNAGADQRVSDVFFATDMWVPFLQVYEPLQRIPVTQGDNAMLSLGFTDSIKFDGKTLWLDPSCPSGNAYGINPRSIEIRSMESQLFNVEEGQYDNHTQSTDHVVSTLSNLLFKNINRNFRLTNVTGNAPT